MGLALALGWAVYAYFVPMHMGAIGPFTWMALGVTCPVAVASLQIHFPLQLAWVLVINAATFAAVGAVVEMLRRQFAH